MATLLKIGLVNIPIMLINYSNSRYSTSGLHQFSSCCSASVGNKKYCKECGKDLLTDEIRKGTDKETILTEGQAENLKELLDNGSMEVLAIQDFKEKMLLELIPFIQKTQLILPSISKNYRKADIRTYYSFINALKENNKMCLVKLVNRGLEHIGLLVFKQEDLMFIEVPFKNYNNLNEINRLKEGVKDTIRVDKINNLEQHKEQAKVFVEQFNNKENDLELIKEEKQILLKKMVENIREGIEIQNEIKEVSNPFG
ncbi:MAG TPA: Ku protein [Candidatus Paceibacterota bacterium]|nr:Ku protein [Candidatus Paceibacterota bacterium]